MPLFSEQKLSCCICRTRYSTTANSGSKWKEGVCSMRCYYEKQWRETLSIMGKEYYPDPREYDASGYPKTRT